MANRAIISPSFILEKEKTLRNNEHSDFDIKKILIDKGTPDQTIELFKLNRKSESQPFFKEEETPKEGIVLHYTQGQLEGDLETLTGGGVSKNVSVSYVIGRDGSIYLLFNSRFWSYHLGRETVGGNEYQSRRTIGIELSNVGSLSKVGDEYFMRVDIGDNKFKDLFYCSENETDLYQEIAQPFRGQKVFATFTEAQYDAVIRLLRYLTSLWKIERKFLENRFTTDESIMTKFKGIASHVNYRKDGKEDIGPAFDWEKVIKGVQAETYTSTMPAKRGLSDEVETVESENEIQISVGAARGIFEEPTED